jgi:serine/threonine protein phosphatase PrpC
LTEGVDAAWAGAPTNAPARPVAFGFNLGKIPGQGEDSDPILRAGPSLALLGVFDGMGGAGGTVYETPDGPRTGAYIASRIARDVVEQRMVELLRPDWYLDGGAAAAEIQRTVKTALQERLRELDAPKSGLRSKLLRALPTTMALVALQRKAGSDGWVAHVLWAGDSRAYVFEPGGMRQLTTDDLRDPGDAMENLRRDSVVGNAMSADVDFHVSYRKVELREPFLLMCATDGCYGYVPSPMHFEHLVLSKLQDAGDVEGWSLALQKEITAVTGDDAAMATLAFGVDFPQLRTLLSPRTEELSTTYLQPLEAAMDAVARAEDALQAARLDQERTTAMLWSRYKPGYEHHLRDAGTTDDTGAHRDPDDPALRDLWAPGAWSTAGPADDDAAEDDA